MLKYPDQGTKEEQTLLDQNAQFIPRPAMGSGILCVVGGRGGVGRIVCMFRQDWHQEEVTAFLPHHSHPALFNHTLREGQARRRRP